MEPYETFEHNGKTIKIYSDEDPPNPRTEFDHAGTMVCFHRRYVLGDKNHGLSFTDYNNSWDELHDAIQRQKGGAVIFPLYLYDHSGLRIRAGSFQGLLPQGHAEFDSGQVGFIFVSKTKVLSEFGWKSITAKRRAVLEEGLLAEVEEYDQYLSGDVWGYTVTTHYRDELTNADVEQDSCWGCFGLDYARKLAKEAAE